MDTFKLKPGSPGLIVRDPVTGVPLAENGEIKPQDQYWQRRIDEGDAVVVTDEPARKTPKLEVAA